MLCKASDASAPSAHAVCTDAQATSKTKECVSSDAGAVKCLRDGGDQCACVRGAPGALACLGSCWTKIQHVLCKQAPEDNISEKCSETKSTVLTRQCLSQDATLVACIQNGGDKCSCFQQSAHMKQCLGACHGKINSAFCKITDPTTSTEPVTKDEQLTTARPSRNAHCDEDTAIRLMAKCVIRNARVSRCILDAGGECNCMQENPSTKSCLGTCWQPVHEQLCGRPVAMPVLPIDETPPAQKPASTAPPREQPRASRNQKDICTTQDVRSRWTDCSQAIQTWVECSVSHAMNLRACQTQYLETKACFSRCWETIAATFTQALTMEILVQRTADDPSAAVATTACTKETAVSSARK